MHTPWFVSTSLIHLLNYDLKEFYSSLRFERDTRYYELRLNKDLLGDWIITLINGRIKSKLGQSRTLAFVDFDKGLEQLIQLCTTRHRRGYHLKWIDCDHPLFVPLLSCVKPSSSKQKTGTDSIHLINRHRKRSINSSFTSNLPILQELSVQQMDLCFK